jgi:hypothetical protein
MNNETDRVAPRRFLWGVALAWLPFLAILLPAVMTSFRGLSAEKATGLAAIAGGLGEALATFGLGAALTFEIVALILLLRSLSGSGPRRIFLSALSLGCSVFVLAVLAFFIWLSFFRHAAL